MTAMAPIFSPRFGRMVRPKRTKAPLLVVLAKLGFVLAVGFIGGVLLGLISLKSEAPRLAEADLSPHQTQDIQDDSAVAVDSVSRRAARVVAAKRKAAPEAFKRAAKLPLFPQASQNDRLAGNFH
jgi:hypothetical protein